MIKFLGRIVFIVLFLIVTVAGVVIGIDNHQPVSIAFLKLKTPELPLFLWLFMALGIGLFIGVVLASYYGLRAGHQIRKQKKEISVLRTQLTDMPISEPKE
ncbi:LapA family protein [Gynuella sunshinyii]|uniref:Lipopolysaccharide assembly protein A domain-containing protein n=1 Tax=Gynuella sunshinyii YC6258 TaxID=1445510 RepID=A0A0C5VMD9_9GAMM|nr:LapA family protein [Gynuella sunshinyii]AJQ95887.1 hypothetical Protein YC6258_03851 [Gynuella sunshinyii YC6258]